MPSAFVALLSACLFAVTGCAPQSSKSPKERNLSFPEPHATFVYRCDDGYRFVARFDDPKAPWLFLPEKTVRARFAGESGEALRYAVGNGAFLFAKEESAIRVAGARHNRCRNDRRAAIWERAKLDGYDFRAVGNEPPWILLFRGGRATLYTGYEKRRHLFEGKIRSEKGRSLYEGKGPEGTLRVVLEPGPCSDSMADERYETRVTVEWKGRRLRGCGNPLH